uniref:DNA-directed RNA polymerase n=1 Tax=Kalanchoe fedtschenkoi TaxID=63787 RepID=A0A7N0RAI5_KALFE
MANVAAGGGLTFTKSSYLEDKDAERIKSIEFSVLSEAEILKGAVVEVWNRGYYESDRKPKQHGLLDPHMVLFFS